MFLQQRRPLGVAAVVLFLGLVGCAPAAPADPTSPSPTQPTSAVLSELDAHAISQLAPIAARDAALPNESHRAECWAPSEHKLDTGEFRVICRVYFVQADQERYKDMICIGDLAREPVSDYCYQWAYYSDMPSFEDYPASSG